MNPTTDDDTKFKAIAHANRRVIIRRLKADGELCCGDICQDLPDLTWPAVSRHLRVLEDAGITQRRIDRQRRMVSLRPDGLAFLAEWGA